MAQPKTIARPYAKALFALSSDDSAAQSQWQTFLDTAAEMAEDPEIMSSLNHPDFFAELQTWLNEWLKKARKNELSDQERNFLRLLEEHDRLVVLPEIAAVYTELCSTSQNTTIVRVLSAQAMDDKAQDALSKTMQERLGKAVQLEIEEDPELIAGVVIEYDGQVIDQSMRGRLQQFARKLDD
ncbi:F0F1 ATP synthase subunit delta [Suttonella sp. R2A3]|uniref:F0F1 ATP synthase subunit delta n=1 Tax=Suttonella sp. R2A3 TaxID=2908648 RepID=UPI001F1BE90B|nr:F0F1 ATP synthase subunit delta [Suttonella sp. R2A3]UJF23971.1 F0F1 ATP synthase subunit delta [Suttonella sp. R2A3]